MGQKVSVCLLSYTGEGELEEHLESARMAIQLPLEQDPRNYYGTRIVS